MISYHSLASDEQRWQEIERRHEYWRRESTVDDPPPLPTLTELLSAIRLRDEALRRCWGVLERMENARAGGDLPTWDMVCEEARALLAEIGGRPTEPMRVIPDEDGAL